MYPKALYSCNSRAAHMKKLYTTVICQDVSNNRGAVQGIQNNSYYSEALNRESYGTLHGAYTANVRIQVTCAGLRFVSAAHT